MSRHKRIGITDQQRRAIGFLLQGYDQRQSARLVGVNERTVRRWLCDERFRQALQEAILQARA